MGVTRPPHFAWTNDLEATLSGLESGLKVRDIATFQMATCAATAIASEVLALPAIQYFDQIPVVEGGHVVGVLERDLDVDAADRDGPVATTMRALDDSMLVEAELPLPRFLPLAVASPYYLVVVGSHVGGLVTRSDLLKLPVRLVAFAHVAHLEARMAALIRARSSGNEWLELVDDKGKRVSGRGRKLALERLDPDILELTFFSEKRQVIGRLVGMTENEKASLLAVENMRNDVTHGNDYGRTGKELDAFIRCLSTAEEWIGRLDGFIASSTREVSHLGQRIDR